MEIHGTLQLGPAAVEARLKKIEEKLDGKEGKGVLAWILDVLKTLLPSVVLALLGFALKDTVDQALREREIQLEAVKEMEKLAPDLQKTDLVRIDAQAKAAQLAAFGRYSVPFFVNILEVGNQNAALGAEDGLRMVARSEPDDLVIVIGLEAWSRQATGAVLEKKSGHQYYRRPLHLVSIVKRQASRVSTSCLGAGSVTSSGKRLATCMRTFIALRSPVAALFTSCVILASSFVIHC